MKILIIGAMAIAGLMWSETGDAQTERSSIARCAAIGGPTQRLVCYDSLAKRLGVAAPAVSTPPAGVSTGKWKVRMETSPIDDSKNAYASIDANETIPSMISRVRPSLMLRCKEKTTEAYITWNVFIGTDETDVLTRLDSETAVKSAWSISTDHEATFYGGNDISFIKQLFGHRKFLAQVTPYGESPVIVTFDVAGIEEAVKPLQSACGWK